MKRLQRICMVVCVLSVVLAVPLVLMMIWKDDWDVRLGLYVRTLGVFFVAGALVLSVLKMVTPPAGDAK